MRRTALLVLLAAGIFFAASAAAQSGTAATVVRGIYFTETGCSHCDAFLYAGKERLEKERRVKIELETRDILSDSGYELCVAMLAERGLPFTSFPVLFIEGATYRGSTAIERNLGPDIDSFLRDGVWPPGDHSLSDADAAPSGGAEKVRADLEEGTVAVAALPVLLAGLLDGINPCAFSALLFFLSFVSLRKKRKEAVFLTGLAFISGVFIAYLCIGFGLLASLRAIFSAGRFSIYLNVAVSALALVLAALNLRDARLAKLGKLEESTLKLPKPLRAASHRVMRRGAGGAGIAMAFIAGGAVSLIELACTGQIYLPTIVYLNRSAFTARGAALLLAYNIAFVFPLVLVFVLFYLGLTHERIQAWYRRKIALVRVLTAAFFLAMGTLVWIV